MPFVKLDAGILTSTLWEEPDATKLVFLTALLMATPHEVTEVMEQLEVRDLKTTGFVVQPGWYGFVPAAGIGIIRQARVETEPGYAALEKLGSPDAESRSDDFEGRRLVRVGGGYIVLNFFKFRDRDYTAAERMRKLRARKGQKSASDVPECSPNECDVTRNNRNVRANVTHSRGQSTEAEKINTSCSNSEKPSSNRAIEESLFQSNEKVTAGPTPPVVEEIPKPAPKATAKPSHEAEKLAALLSGEIRRNKPDYRITPATQRAWAVTADRMLRLDGRSYGQIFRLIRWCQADDFEHKNVVSMEKLRLRFDQLELKAGLGNLQFFEEARSRSREINGGDEVEKDPVAQQTAGCARCAGAGMLRRGSHEPGPRLISCPDCNAAAAILQAKLGSSSLPGKLEQLAASGAGAS